MVIGIWSFTVGLKICKITAGIKVMIQQPKKRKSCDKIVLLAKIE